GRPGRKNLRNCSPTCRSYGEGPVSVSQAGAGFETLSVHLAGGSNVTAPGPLTTSVPLPRVKVTSPSVAKTRNAAGQGFSAPGAGRFRNLVGPPRGRLERDRTRPVDDFGPTAESQGYLTLRREDPQGRRQGLQRARLATVHALQADQGPGGQRDLQGLPGELD